MILILVVLVVVILSVSVAFELTGDRVLRSRSKRRVVVTTTSGSWFSGVLFSHDRRCIVLRDAHTEVESGTAAIDGEVLILMSDVAHIQFP